MTLTIDWLPQTAFQFLLIFARVGTMLMLMPALGESMIPARVRLGFALMLSLVFLPLMVGYLPSGQFELFGAFGLMFHEIAVGLILGGIARMIVMATQTAGATIAFQMGLSMAQTADPTQPGVQGAIVGNFLTIVGIALIFATNLHYLVLAAIHDSYMIFPPDAPLMFDDAMVAALNAVASAFTIGVQMAAPFIVFGLVFYLGLGLLARLMPQLQVFFIAMPANIGVGLILLAILITSVMGWYLTHFESHFAMLLG